jgi:hypothetical protein
VNVNVNGSIHRMGAWGDQAEKKCWKDRQVVTRDGIFPDSTSIEQGTTIVLCFALVKSLSVVFGYFALKNRFEIKNSVGVIDDVIETCFACLKKKQVSESSDCLTRDSDTCT